MTKVEKENRKSVPPDEKRTQLLLHYTNDTTT